MKTNQKFQMSKEELKNVLGGLGDGTVSTGCWGACGDGCKDGCLTGCKLGQSNGSGLFPPVSDRCVALGRM